MAAKALPAQEVLNQLLSYDPETGLIFWKERRVDSFETVRAANVWNTRFAGKKAFYGLDALGYAQGRIRLERYKAHRIIWKLVYGSDPFEVDHINGDRADNRLINLRDVSHAINGKNQSLRQDTSSGVTGICWEQTRRKWRVRIMIDQKSVSVGRFISFDEAVAARRAAEVQHGFHPNHGRN